VPVSYAEALQRLREEGLHRSLKRIDGSQGPRVMLGDRRMVLLCSNNYLGLASDARLKEAAIRATEKYGVGTGASRLVSGTMELHEVLEQRLARFKGTEAALVFNSGYAANTGVIPALVGKGDVVFSDRLNHASIVDGCLLSRARMVRYPHGDTAALRRLMAAHRGDGRCMIVTDGVFSMDGDMAPLVELVELKHEFDALLMVDDAHGTGVLGTTGRGTAEHLGVISGVDVHMGTLGKALGSFGAFVAASGEIIEYLVNQARPFIFSTSLPPAVLASALAALDIVDSDGGAALRMRLQRHADFFQRALCEVGFDTMGSVTQIVPILVGGAEQTMEFSGALFDAGFYIQGIRPPTVPTGGSRLRCTLMATHEEDELAGAVELITRVGKRLGLV